MIKKRSGSGCCETVDGVDEAYHPVRCSVCNTEVGVYDRDEVYHFFNILSGYS